MSNSKHVTIYAAETGLKKVTDFVNETLETKPRMYEKTKVRYRNMMLEMASIIRKMSRILQEGELSSISDDEFEELASEGFGADMDSALQLAQREIEEAKTFSSSKKDSSNKQFVDLPMLDSVFLELSRYDFGWEEVNLCADLLYRWFHNRFIVYPTPKCNYSYIGNWVHKFILQFGNHCKVGKQGNFELSLDSWCDRLTYANNIYAQPFFIYNVLESKEPADFTLQAVLINDLLYSQCLCKLPPGYANFDSMEVCRIVKDRNPSLVPVINSRFAKQEELLESVEFTRS